MKSRVFLAAALAFSLLGGVARANVDAVSRAALDKEVEQALAAYNAGNARAFYANWASLTKSMETDEEFKKQYLGTYQKNFGAYKSRTLIDAESVVSTSNAVMVYRTVFSKKPGTLSVDFIKEGSVYKIQGIEVKP